MDVVKCFDLRLPQAPLIGIKIEGIDIRYEKMSDDMCFFPIVYQPC